MSFIQIEEDDNININTDDDDNFSICDHIYIQHQNKLQQKQNQLNFDTNLIMLILTNSSLQILQFYTNQDQSILQILTNSMPTYQDDSFVQPQIQQSQLKLIRFFQNLTNQLRYREHDQFPQKKHLDIQHIIHISHTLLFSSIRSCLPQYRSKEFLYFLQINRYNIKSKEEDSINDQCEQAKQIKLNCQRICELFSKESKELTEIVQRYFAIYRRRQIQIQCLMAILQKLLYNIFVSKSLGIDIQELVQKSCKVSYELILSFYSEKKFQLEDLKRQEQIKLFLLTLSPQQIILLEEIQKQKPQIIWQAIQRRELYQNKIKEQKENHKKSLKLLQFKPQQSLFFSKNTNKNCEKGNEFENQAEQILKKSQDNNKKNIHINFKSMDSTILKISKHQESKDQ